MNEKTTKMPVGNGESVFLTPKSGDARCEVHDWKDEEFETRLLPLMRERHGKGGLNVCVSCIERARSYVGAYVAVEAKAMAIDAWWSALSIDEFGSALDSMTTKEHEALSSELASVSAMISPTVSDTTLNADARRRARYLLAGVSEKRRVLNARLMTAHVASRESKKNEAEDILEYAEARVESEPAEAMRSIIRTMKLMWGLGPHRDAEERGRNE
jgi:hypothetical protein